MRISRHRVGRIALCYAYLLRSTFIRLVGYSQSLTIPASFDGHDNRATRILYAFSMINDFGYIVNCNRRKWLTPVKLAKEKPNSIIEESRIRPPPPKVGFYVSLSLRIRVQLRITILFRTVVESERTRSTAIRSVASQSPRSHSNFGARARLLFWKVQTNLPLSVITKILNLASEARRDPFRLAQIYVYLYYYYVPLTCMQLLENTFSE